MNRYITFTISNGTHIINTNPIQISLNKPSTPKKMISSGLVLVQALLCLCSALTMLAKTLQPSNSYFANRQIDTIQCMKLKVPSCSSISWELMHQHRYEPLKSTFISRLWFGMLYILQKAASYFW